MPLVASTSHSSGSWWILLAFLAVYIAFYVMYLRPRMRRSREARMGNRKFEVGDRVQTVGGLVATLVTLDDHVATLRTDGGQELTFLRQAIHQVYKEPASAPADDAAIGPAEGTTH